jgi:uncharacterized protein
MGRPMERKSIWWHEPMVWLIITLPLAAVIGGFVTAWFAVNGADPLVTEEDLHKEGMALHQSMERYEQAARLGMNASLEVGNGMITVHLKGRMDRFPDLLTLAAIHPSRADDDATMKLPAVAAGVYRASLPDMIASKRRLILEPPDRSWRLTGRWQAPFTGLLILSPKQELSATRP